MYFERLICTKNEIQKIRRGFAKGAEITIFIARSPWLGPYNFTSFVARSLQTELFLNRFCHETRPFQLITSLAWEMFTWGIENATSASPILFENASKNSLISENAVTTPNIWVVGTWLWSSESDTALVHILLTEAARSKAVQS